MKILYVINSMEGGGAQTAIPDILEAFESAGAETRLVALTRRNGLAIEPLEARGLRPVVREGGERDHFRAMRWIQDQARDFGADAIWTSLTRSTLLGQFAGQKLGIPVVSWQHNAFLKPWNERLLRWRSKASCLWVADSDQVARLTRRLGVPADRIETWPIFCADPDAPRAKPWRPGEVLRLGSLGRLHPAKGYDLLIEALAWMRQQGFESAAPFRISIAGTGKDEAELKAMCVARGVDCLDFMGFASDPQAFLAAQHLYLQPSRREGFCIAAHEAMQAELPVLVSATGEMPHTVDGATMGRIFEVGDVPTLGAALAELLSQPEALHAMGQQARVRVLEKFSREAFQARGDHFIQQLRVLARNDRPGAASATGPRPANPGDAPV